MAFIPAAKLEVFNRHGEIAYLFANTKNQSVVANDPFIIHEYQKFLASEQLHNIYEKAIQFLKTEPEHTIDQLDASELPTQIDQISRKYIAIIFNHLLKENVLSILDLEDREIIDYTNGKIIVHPKLLSLAEQIENDRSIVTTTISSLKVLKHKNLNHLKLHVFTNEQIRQELERSLIISNIVNRLGKYQIFETFFPDKYKEGDFGFLGNDDQKFADFYHTFYIPNKNEGDEKFAENLNAAAEKLSYAPYVKTRLIQDVQFIRQHGWEKYVDLQINNLRRELYEK